MSEELDTRVAVLEVKGEVQAEKLDKIEENLKETHSMVFSIKERLDKQNGAIPHMAEKIDKMSEVVYELKENQSAMQSEQTKDGTKLHIIWGIGGIVGGGILSYAIKLLIGH